MSKSLGNVVDPMNVINGGKNQQKDPAYGADVLRLWVSSVDYTNDVSIGPNILKQIADIYRKVRNTARFLLGSLADFDPSKNAVSQDKLPKLDRYMLHRMQEVFSEIDDAYKKYQFFRVFQAIQNFCIVDLSNFYLDIAKDRLYISSPNSLRRRSCQTILAIALENIARAIAPILCHMAEDIWQYLPYPHPAKSVFQSGWLDLDSNRLQPSLADKWVKLRSLRDNANKVMDAARTDKLIGASLEAKVLIYAKDSTFADLLNTMLPEGENTGNGVDELRYLFLTSQVELVRDRAWFQEMQYSIDSDLASIGIVKADGTKCDRCWNYSTTVGEDPEHPTICTRCTSALSGFAG
jgi:isoleucyl-tRNA synthetase